MSRSLITRTFEAAVRLREGVRWERLRPEPSLGEIAARMGHAGSDGAVSATWSGLLALHLDRTPTDLWSGHVTVTPAAAALVRAGRAELLGRVVDATPATDWHEDPFHQVRWPRRYTGSMPFTRPGSDLVLLWHLNKTRFLLERAALYRETRDPSLASDIYAVMDSWCSANPYLVGANWLSPMEAGTRMVVWSMALAALTDAARPDDAVCGRILRALVRHYDFVAGHFSHRAIPNNHLIGEAALLHAFTSYWPELTDGAARAAGARQTLAAEAGRQILKDGVQYEGSVNYHCYALDFFLVYLHGELIARSTPEAAVVDAVRAMASVVPSLVSPSGRLPAVGDDSMCSFFVLEDVWPPRAPAAERIVFGHFVRAEHRRLFEASGWARDLLTAGAPVSHARHFDEAGFSVIRDPAVHITFTHGPQHRRPFSHGHLHADMGAFEFEIDGTPLIVDSGTYLYGLNRVVRDHFRGAHGHNAPVIDGIEPMQGLEAFSWASIATGEYLGLGTNGRLGATAFRRRVAASGNVQFEHTRALVRADDVVLVVDVLRPRAAATSHSLVIDYHTTTPAGSGVCDGNRAALSDPRRFVRVLEAFADRDVRVSILDPGALGSGYSPVYGRLERGVTVRVAAEFETELALVTVIRSPEVTVRPLHLAGSEVTCSIETHGRRRVARVQMEPFRVEIAGHVLIGRGAPTRPVADPERSQADLDWLDELA